LRAVPDGAWAVPFSVVYTNGAGTGLRLVTTSASGSTSISLTLTDVVQ
jgi:hypothetical protein